MKAIVTGASGMLGSAVYRELLYRKEDVEGWSHSTEKAGKLRFRRLQDVDLYLPEDLDLLVHCAALTDADYCEVHPTEAKAVNALWSEELATLAKKVGARFVYVSTDAVYGDTEQGRRREDEQPDPQSVYAKTKLEGEGRVLSAYPEALVVRTTMFGWTLKTAPRPKFAEQILGALTARTPMKVFRDAYFSPLHVDLLGDVILDLAEVRDLFDRRRMATGVWNVGARRPVNKMYFAQLVADTFGLDAAFLVPCRVDDVELRARRTKNVGLDVSRVEMLLGPMPTVESGVYQLYQEAFDGTAKKIRGRETYP